MVFGSVEGIVRLKSGPRGKTVGFCMAFITGYVLGMSVEDLFHVVLGAG